MPNGEPKPTAAEIRAENDAEELLVQQTSASLWKENRQVFVLGAGVIVFLLIAHFTPLQAWLTNWQQWKRYIDEFGLAAHAVFMLVTIIAVMSGLPRLPLCSVAGAVFGFREGLLISWLGSALGSYGAFLLSRWGGRSLAEERIQQWPWLRSLLSTPTLLRVIWVRQLMVPGFVLNLLLGMTSVKHRTFLAGTLLGYLPLNIALTLVGSGLGKESLAQSLKQVLAALAVINLLAWAVMRMVKKRRKSQTI